MSGVSGVSGVSLCSASRPAIQHGFRLQWEPAQGTHVLLYPEGMVKLNGSAGEILKRCDGHASIAEITTELERVFSKAGLHAEVVAFLQMAVHNGWLTVPNEPV